MMSHTDFQLILNESMTAVLQLNNTLFITTLVPVRLFDFLDFRVGAHSRVVANSRGAHVSLL